ncbi:IS3 family transposase [Paenibacillus sp. cl141a]
MEEYIRFYNQHRPQRRLDKLPPIEYRKQLFSPSFSFHFLKNISNFLK